MTDRMNNSETGWQRPVIRVLTTVTAMLVAVGGSAAAVLPAGGTGPGGVDVGAAPVCASFAPDPFLVRLVPTARANGASGVVRMHFAPSPFGVTVTVDGHHDYGADVETAGLPDPAGAAALVVWAATPSLDQVTRLGVLDGAGRVSGTIAYNKFLVFVTAEPSADVARWSGPILLRGASASARMHSMVGHGPFSSESCNEWGFGPGAPGGSGRSR